MPRFVSIAKAAQLANVPAKEIQKKIATTQLPSTRGKIHIDDLLECFPNVDIEEADMLALVAKIKEQSFAVGAAKQHAELSRADLKLELNKLKANAEYYREQSQKFEDLILHLRNNLEEIQQKTSENQRIQALVHWIDQRLSEIRRND